MFRKYLFFLLILSISCNSLSLSQEEPALAKEFSLNFYDQTGKLRLIVPVDQLEYVEWGDQLTYNFKPNSLHALSKIDFLNRYLSGGRVETVFQHQVIKTDTIRSAFSSYWYDIKKNTSADHEGHLYFLPDLPLYPPDLKKEELYQYFKEKGKLKE